MKLIFVLTLFISVVSYASSYEFLPVENENLSIEFPGRTNMGDGIHKLEIRRLGYDVSFYKEGKVPTYGYYLIYFSHEEYGPDILGKLDGHTPYLEQIDKELIEIQFVRGNNGFTKQIWKLMKHTAEMVSEEPIAESEMKSFNE